MNLKEFIYECRKRTIFRELSIYAVSAWLIIQVVATTFPFLGIPKIVVTLVIICALLGLPVIMGFSWYYSVRTVDEGSMALRADVKNPDEAKNLAFKKTYFFIIGVVSIGVLFVVGSLINQNVESSQLPEEIPDAIPDAINSKEGIITIEVFQNKTGDSSLEVIGEMAADRIEHSLTQNNLATVVSNSVFKEYSEIFKISRANGKETPSVYEYLSIDIKIEGNYYLDGESLLFDCSIIDARTGEVKDALATIRSSKVDPLEAIEKIKDKVLGYAAKSAAPTFFIENHTPKYEAYKNLLLRNEDIENELLYLNRAIQIDPDYFEPKLLRLSYYYNQNEFDIVDSLYKSLKQESLLADDRQKNLLAFYNSLIIGNNRLAFDSFLKEYNLAPFHMPSNATMMVMALQFVNKPEVAIDFYNVIPEDGLDLASCWRCQTRAHVRAMALFQMGNYAEAADQLESLLKINDRVSYYRFLAKSYVRLRNWTSLEYLMEDVDNKYPSDLCDLYTIIGKECVIIGEDERAKTYFNVVIESAQNSNALLSLGEAHYYMGDYSKSSIIFEKLLSKNQDDIDLIFWSAASSFKEGDIEKSDVLIERLKLLRNKYDYGAIDYALAKNNMLRGDEASVFSFLKRAVSDGARFESRKFTNDPFFKDILQNDDFEKIMNYWH